MREILVGEAHVAGEIDGVVAIGAVLVQQVIGRRRLRCRAVMDVPPDVRTDADADDGERSGSYDGA